MLHCINRTDLDVPPKAIGEPRFRADDLEPSRSRFGVDHAVPHTRQYTGQHAMPHTRQHNRQHVMPHTRQHTRQHAMQHTMELVCPACRELNREPISSRFRGPMSADGPQLPCMSIHMSEHMSKPMSTHISKHMSKHPSKHMSGEYEFRDLCDIESMRAENKVGPCSYGRKQGWPRPRPKIRLA